MKISSNTQTFTVNFPAICKEEFATVESILLSNAKTKAVDALLLSLTKYEKQLRKILCFLIFQNPAITIEVRDGFNRAITDNKKLYPPAMIQAINCLAAGQVSDWVGEKYIPLNKRLEEINARRNKLIHGQITGEKLSAHVLIADVITILEWVELLARGSKRAVKYDGLIRNTFRQAKMKQRCSKTGFPFETPEELDKWLKKFTHQKK